MEGRMLSGRAGGSFFGLAPMHLACLKRHGSVTCGYVSSSVL